MSPPCWAFADSETQAPQPARPFPHSMPPELPNRPTGQGWHSHPLSTLEKLRTRNSLHKQRGRVWDHSLGFLSGTCALLASLSGDIHGPTGKGAGDRELPCSRLCSPQLPAMGLRGSQARVAPSRRCSRHSSRCAASPWPWHCALCPRLGQGCPPRGCRCSAARRAWGRDLCGD